MYFLAHTGITLAAITALGATVARFPKAAPNTKPWYFSAAAFADIRLLIIGSLLPDIIDKPIGLFLFRDTFSTGRIHGHTLLLLLILLLGGYWLFVHSRRTWLLALGIGTFFHLVLDQMWLQPETLFWPLMGLEFPPIDAEKWLSGMFHNIISSPYLLTTEIIGLVFLLGYLCMLIRHRYLGKLIRYGRLK